MIRRHLPPSYQGALPLTHQREVSEELNPHLEGQMIEINSKGETECKTSLHNNKKTYITLNHGQTLTVSLLMLHRNECIKKKGKKQEINCMFFRLEINFDPHVVMSTESLLYASKVGS